MSFEKSAEYAANADAEDVLKDFRKKFIFPELNGITALYFTGNSLGLQPETAKDALLTEIDDWAKFGVEGHFEARNPWYSYHEMFSVGLSKICGALPTEVVAMGSLTNNLHLLMVSFYRPTKERFKIICEKKAFPSDIYALHSQARFHGFHPNEAVIEVAPREGETTIRHEDILDAIHQHSHELALVMFGGVNYFTGQLFDMKSITEAGHKAGAVVGFDLAHAAGNVKLELHHWNVDFAAWCSYKYLNSGPGSVAGIFVHEKHHKNNTLPRFEGWWGTNPDTRFLMSDTFDSMENAGAWQLSNAPVFSMAVHKASLDIFMEAGMDRLIEKSKKLTAYLEFLVKTLNAEMGTNVIEVITPENQAERGCQLSLRFPGYGKDLFHRLTKHGIIADWREPNVVRVAPVPLYNSFTDVYGFYSTLKSILNSK